MRDRVLVSQQDGVLVSCRSERDFTLGLHERGRFDRIFDLDECHLQSDDVESDRELAAGVRQAGADPGVRRQVPSRVHAFRGDSPDQANRPVDGQCRHELRRVPDVEHSCPN